MATVFELKKLFSLLILAFLLLAGGLFFTTPVNATETGVVCIASDVTSGCPQTSPVFSGSPGTTLTVAVNVQGSNSTNGFDISILTDPSVLNPVSIDYGSTVLPSPTFVAVECINGHVVIGSRCQATDVPGVARLAIVSLGAETTTPTTGNLFTVTFNIVSSISSTIGYQTGCTSSSVPGTSTCVTITQCQGSCSAQPVTVVDPEFAQNAPFSNGSLGGEIVRTNEPTLLTPYVAMLLTIVIISAAMVVIIRLARRTRNQ
jgi:Cohesin domain